ncbi:hypothetical protein COT94_00450 [Candidatus Falkowbacteria bacterium CG10_big_fil_rev_8_21_14_0_10_37_14]|uniref:Uncharacterized protein n=1 Tax=Candidatus Falkowbacteria bacterium CG10_big_fil_rev_8_21_14_0_10_37_14 TaxID=1974561 RepID=A0A2M6WUD6_9BACT|nr:hypothetical protein [Candidatus Falkowbacteria bacterium]PIT96418.1 MAG: hypothetical protein COT94_00450 [Candidatus Falkowbacteria bacterium CG10_big_fil_rev_8_21_14_0_10_37_14]
MKYKLWLPAVLTLMILPVAIWALVVQKQVIVAQTPVLATSGLILYYGDTCPHCKIVQDFLDSSGAAEKLTWEHKEVYRNSTNAAELTKRAESCGLDIKSIGVPFLWADGQCLIGDEPIINYFKQKINYAQ